MSFISEGKWEELWEKAFSVVLLLGAVFLLVRCSVEFYHKEINPIQKVRIDTVVVNKKEFVEVNSTDEIIDYLKVKDDIYELVDNISRIDTDDMSRDELIYAIDELKSQVYYISFYLP